MCFVQRSGKHLAGESFKRNIVVDNVRTGQALWFETVERFVSDPGS